MDALASQAQIALCNQGWQRFPEGAAIVNRTAWSVADLRHALDRLFDAIDAEYKTRQQNGRDSNCFAFYDGGLRVIREALREPTQPLD